MDVITKINLIRIKTKQLQLNKIQIIKIGVIHIKSSLNDANFSYFVFSSCNFILFYLQYADQDIGQYLRPAYKSNYISKSQQLFLNRWFSQSEKNNKKFVNDLNNLGKQSQRIQQLQQKIAMLKNKIDQPTVEEDEKTQCSQRSKRSKTRDGDGNNQERETCQYTSFNSFIQEICKVRRQERSQQKIYLSKQQIAKRLILLEKSKPIVEEVLENEIIFIRKIFKKDKINSLQKFYIIFRLLTHQLSLRCSSDEQLFSTCNQMIKEMLEDFVICAMNTNEGSSNSSSVQQQMTDEMVKQKDEPKPYILQID